MKGTRVLHTENLAIGYHRNKKPFKVAESLNVSLYEGEMVCLLGPNGSGKSTLIRTLAGMQDSLNGEIYLFDDRLDSLNRKALARTMGLVLTDQITIGNLRVYDLVSFGRSPYTGWFGTLQPNDREKVLWAIQATGLESFVERDITRLSDGERQKVMIARALAQDTSLIMLDEPTAHLDLPNRVEIIRLLRELARNTQKTILFSTHELDLALKVADRIWLMNDNGELADGVPEDLVLNGSFEQAFHREKVTFDRKTGSFQIHEKPNYKVRLSGDPTGCFWTRRALEREGFGEDERGDIYIKVTSDEEGYKWCIGKGGREREARSMGKIISLLREYSASA